MPSTFLKLPQQTKPTRFSGMNVRLEAEVWPKFVKYKKTRRFFRAECCLPMDVFTVHSQLFGNPVTWKLGKHRLEVEKLSYLFAGDRGGANAVHF
jgi:hypothetical protein